ncbi:Zinc finger protein [Fusarium oxysporum f. sp. albedinis]|nr:Zinc finger protein [Fusarium oxysporum f. sp. albedinis]
MAIYLDRLYFQNRLSGFLLTDIFTRDAWHRDLSGEVPRCRWDFCEIFHKSSWRVHIKAEQSVTGRSLYLGGGELLNNTMRILSIYTIKHWRLMTSSAGGLLATAIHA